LLAISFWMALGIILFETGRGKAALVAVSLCFSLALLSVPLNFLHKPSPHLILCPVKFLDSSLLCRRLQVRHKMDRMRLFVCAYMLVCACAHVFNTRPDLVYDTPWPPLPSLLSSCHWGKKMETPSRGCLCPECNFYPSEIRDYKQTLLQLIIF
jgi:hypothetical protein